LLTYIAIPEGHLEAYVVYRYRVYSVGLL